MKYTNSPKIQDYDNCRGCDKLLKITALLNGKCVTCNASEKRSKRRK